MYSSVPQSLEIEKNAAFWNESDVLTCGMILPEYSRGGALNRHYVFLIQAASLSGEFESQLRVELVKDEYDLNHDTFRVILQDTGEVLHSKPEADDLEEHDIITETDHLRMITKIGTWLAAQPK